MGEHDAARRGGFERRPAARLSPSPRLPIAEDDSRLAFRTPRNRTGALMLIDDDLEPKNHPKKPKPLDAMSVDDLKAYVDELKAEVARAEAAIAAKSAHLAAADAFFKKSG